MALMRARVELTGFEGAPGLNTWHFLNGPLTQSDADVISGALFTFYEDVRDALISQFEANAPLEVAEVDVATGQTTNVAVPTDTSWTVDPPAGGSNTSRATQAKVRLLTGAFVNGRQIRGGIFLGPVGEGALDNDGNISTAKRAAIVAAAQAMQAALTVNNIDLCVYSRPKDGQGGSTARAVSVDVAPRPAVLRSRRD